MQVPPFHGQIGFNAHHAPMGAYFSFTCGHLGSRGGLAAQLGKPANQDLYIGIKEGTRFDAAPIRCLPFFDGARAFMTEPGASFVLEKAGGRPQSMSAYGPKEMSRLFAWSTDTWKTRDFEFTLFSPFGAIPDPARSNSATMRAALLPAITAELIVDNTRGTSPKTAFFALNFNEGGARILDEGLSSGRLGFALRSELGVAGEAIEITNDGTRLGEEESGIHPFLFMRWNLQEGIEERDNPVHLLGVTPGIGVEVPPGRRVVLRLALGCYLPGVVTTRLEGRYLYTRYFTSLTDVLNEALTYHRFAKVDCNTLNDHLLLGGGRGIAGGTGAGSATLNRDQQFLIAQATRSYYANTQLLEVAGQPYWIVNEGEYCMMNTLDLAVDQLFWELEWNPWLVRNLLDNFVRFYSYHDQLKSPTGDLVPGGLSFCHDQGVHNQFAPFGHSAYELKNLPGCFSYMTQEQLCNWILLAASYVAKTNDLDWLTRNAGTLDACITSLARRDHAQRAHRDGIPKHDSALCGSGQEITTYDSLDPSLGQARASLYLTMKCWAAHVGLLLLNSLSGNPAILDMQGDPVSDWLTPDDFLPAILDDASPAHLARILPAIEPLIYPLYWRAVRSQSAAPGGGGVGAAAGDLFEPFAELLATLKKHTVTLLADPQHRNHFPDGGIRLSSTSDNSWLSKIALVQHVARELFNLGENGQPRKYRGDASGWEKADAAHLRWLTEGESAFWAASDQIINGTAKGSRYYPRLITTALWLKSMRP